MEELVGKRVHKVSDVEKGMLLRIGGERWLYVRETLLYPTTYSVTAKPPGTFVQKLRKEIGGKKLEGVTVAERERIIEMKIGEHVLLFELFPRGNVVLLKDGSVVMATGYTKRYPSPGSEYVYPEPMRVRKRGPEAELIEKGIPPLYARYLVSHNLSEEYFWEEMVRRGRGYVYREWVLAHPLLEEEHEEYDTLFEALDSLTLKLFTKREEKKSSKKEHMIKQLQELEKEIEYMERLLNTIYEDMESFKNILEGGETDKLVVERRGDTLDIRLKT